MITRLNTLLTSSKWTAGLLLILIIVPMAFGVGAAINNQFWYGINELLADRDVSSTIRYSIGGYGILHAAMEGAIWGCVFGWSAGAAAGAVASV